MQLRTIALSVATAAVLGALVILFVQVRATPDIDVPPDELEQARARYQRTQAARAPRPRASRPITTTRRAATRSTEAASPTSAEREDEREDDGDSERRRPAINSPDQPLRKASQDTLRAAYDRGDFEGALDNATQHLREYPNDRYAQRVIVVAACALGEAEVARRYYEAAIPQDQRIMEIRCGRYNFDL
ncbi:hypothetical protein [Haliangium sp.]|uniref:hypothetical protein n=1 Tax=Haliangium sp. TaxID=2663208 RepID=UPI003D0E4252